jgi:MFS family permease
MFSIYVLANLALALQNNYAALLVLRMVQSLGCSATIAISYSMIADVLTLAEGVACRELPSQRPTWDPS